MNPAVKLTKKISSTHFFIFNFLILILGFSFLFGLYYILNIQYKVLTTPFSNGPVTSKPSSFTLNLTQPEDETLSNRSSILLSGKTSPHLQVLISTDLGDLVLESKSDGSFSTTLNLDEGVNNIKVVVFDPTGDTKIIERLVYYSKEKLQ